MLAMVCFDFKTFDFDSTHVLAIVCEGVVIRDDVNMSLA